MKSFKQFVFLSEDFSSAKMLTFDVGSRFSVKKLFVFLEQLKTFNFHRYMSSFSTSRMKDIVNDVDAIKTNGLRFIITRYNHNILIAVWVGDTLHEQVVQLLDHNKTEKKGIPNIPFQQRYKNAYSKKFDESEPLFPGILLSGDILTGIPKENVLKMKSILNSIHINETEVQQD